MSQGSVGRKVDDLRFGPLAGETLDDDMRRSDAKSRCGREPAHR
jgi:hypothetical protein